MKFAANERILVVLFAFMVAATFGEHPEYPNSDEKPEFFPESDDPALKNHFTDGTTTLGNMSDKELFPFHHGVHFFAFPDKNKHTEVRLGDRRSLADSGLIPGQPVVIFAHGFRGRAPQRKHYSIINAYINEGTSNVVVVNYQSADPGIGEIPIVMGISISYLSAQWKYAPSTGQRIAEFILFLKENGIIKDATQIHLIGHSLGGHVMGVAGHLLRTKYGMKIGRITGLDVAGPMYDHFPLENKLDSSDASFVDVVHTNIDCLGIPHAIGHVDYYVNGGLGRSQNRCQFSPYKFRRGLDRIVAYRKTVICAHMDRPIQIWGYGVSKRLNLRACPCSSTSRKWVNVIKDKLNFTAPAVRIEGADSKLRLEAEAELRQKDLCAKASTRSNCIRFGEYTPSSSRGRYYLQISDRTFKQIMDSSRRNSRNEA